MLGRLGAHPLESVDLLGDRQLHRVGGIQLVQAGAELAGHVVVALTELLADGGQLLAQHELALLLAHPLVDVVADGLRHLQLGEVGAGPGVDGVHPVGQVDGRQHAAAVVVGEVGPVGHGVGQRARVADGGQDLRQAAGPAQRADQLQRGAQLAGGGVHAGGRGGVGDHLDLGECDCIGVGHLRRTHAGPAEDLQDGGRLAVGQVAHVRHGGDDPDATAGTLREDGEAAVGVGTGGVHRGAHGGVGEVEGDGGPGKDHVGEGDERETVAGDRVGHVPKGTGRKPEPLPLNFVTSV